MASATIKNIVEGLIVKDLTAVVNVIDDPVDAISNGYIEVVEKRDIVRYYTADANAITAINANGTVAAGSKAYYSDRTFTDDYFSLGEPVVKKMYFGRQAYNAFGITTEMLNMLKSGSPVSLSMEQAITQASIALSKELMKDYEDFKQYRRSQVNTFLDNLGSGASAAVKPFGKELVANSRTTIWQFDNLSGAALSEAEFNTALDACSKQVDINGHEVGWQEPLYLLHGSKGSLAKQILMPEMVVDANLRSLAEQAGMKKAGTYLTSGTSDWVLITNKHSIKRLVLKGYENFVVRIEHLADDDLLMVEFSDSSIISCDSPVGLYKSIIS